MVVNITQTPIQNLLVIETKIFLDERGFFMESYSKKDFADAGITDEFVQENHSRSQKGVLRGMHFQDLEAPMTKLVRCTRGTIFDVAVDLRSNSRTYGQWFGVELSEENKKMFYVPVGFAHGFQNISDVADIQYKQTNYYLPHAEKSIAWNDPNIKIDWPLPDPILSERDSKAMSFAEYRNAPIFT